MPLSALPDVVPLALAGTSFALGGRHGVDCDHIGLLTGVASLVLGALILTGYSGVVTPLVES